MPEGFHFEVTGLREMVRDLRAMDSELPGEVRRGLKAAADIVAQEGRRRAPVRSGMLEKSIKPRSGYSTAKVVATAKRKSQRYPSGYPYPSRIEFAGGGVRAFLRPALEAKRSEVEEKLGEVVDNLTRRHWGNR